MKKRFLMAMLVVALLVVAAAFTVQAEDFDITAFNCPCPTCNNSPYSGTWKTSFSTTDGDHVYLKDQGTIPRTAAMNFTEGQTVVVVLDNTTIDVDANARCVNTSSGAKVYYIGVNGAAITGKGNNSSTGNGGLFVVNAGCELHFSGDLTLGRKSTSTNIVKTGGVISVSSGVLKLDGVTINGTDLSAVASSCGGAIYATQSTVTINNATITGGKAVSGGNIYASGTTVTVTGTSVIENGEAVSYGGNAYLAYNTTNKKAGNLVLKGGTVKDGTVTVSGDTVDMKKGGGNVYVARASSLEVNTGATVSGGTVTNGCGGSVFLRGKIMVKGGTVTGGSAVYGGTIYGYDQNETATSTTYAYVSLTSGTITGGTATEDGGAIYLNSYGSASITGGTINGGTATEGGALYMAANSKVTMSAGTMNAGSGVYRGGAVYVAASSEFTLSGSATINGSALVGTNTSSSKYTRGGAVCMMGKMTQSGGSIVGGDAYQGGCVFINGTYNMSSGTINASTATAYDASKNVNGTYNGGALYIAAGTTTLSGGTITGAQASLYYGGAIYSGGTLKLTGATVTSGHAKSGGNLYISAGTVTISGDAKITAGVSSGTGGSGQGGGNIYQKTGTITMSGGTIENATYATGTNPQGGNIRQDGGTFTITNGVIQNGSTLNLGGNARIAGTFNVQGGQILGGTSTSSGGSLAIADPDAVLNISAGTISGGDGTQAKNGPNGGLLYINAGTVTISGTAVMENGYATYGGLIQVAGGTLNVTGGTLQNGKSSARGGNIYRSSGALNISGGTISGGNSEDGGNVYAFGGTISGGTIQGGVATGCGGNIFHAGLTLTISGGTITEGSAKTGGNIYSYDGALNIVEAAEKTVIISDGAATGAGGNLYVGSTNEKSDNTTTERKSVVTITMTNGKISGGTASNGAGIYSNSEVTFTSGTIEGGVSKHDGGTIYQANGTHGDTFTMTGGTINGGQSTSYQGGVAFVAAGAKMNISGGTINVATTGNACKGIRVVDGAVTLSGDATINHNGLRIGDAVDVVDTDGANSASLTLAGNASIYNVGTAAATGIHIQNYSKYHAKLIVKDDWTGSAEFFMEYYGTSNNKEATLTYGDTIVAEVGAVADASDDGIGAFTGKLTYTGLSGDPQVFGDGANLVVGKTAIRTADAYQWFIDNAAAVAAYAAVTDPAYIRFYTNDTVDLTGLEEVYIDLNGQDVEATGDGIIYVIDTTTGLTAGSEGSITGVDVETYTHNPLSNYRYIALGDRDDGYRVHCLEIAVSGVSVRPSSAGIYYNATIKCDDDLKALLDTYGVAVSVATMPNDQFWLAGSQALYTALDKEKFVSGKSFTGVIINNIMKEGNATNGARAEMPIYANAYVSFEIDGDPFIIMADETYQGLDITDPGFGGIAKSLKGLMPEIDRIYFSLDEATQRTGLRAMYEKYSDVMSGWGLTNIPAAVNGTTTVNKGTLKVLTIGNSLSVDANRMLAAVAQAEGMEGMTVGTLYYSGCTLAQHVKFLSTAEKEYVYYESGFGADFEANKTIGTGIVPTTKSAYTMEMGLEAQDWDIIVMQQGVTTAAQASTYNSNIQTIIDVVKEYCPEAKLYWNNVWASPMDEACRATANNGIAPDYAGSDAALKEALGYAEDQALDAAAQMKMFNMINAAVQTKIVTNPNFVRVIPSGTAVQNANTTFLTDVELYRDYVHGSSYTRLMTAYVWYCVLTGQDQITELKMDTIPTTLFSGSKEVINPPTEDVVLEEVYQNIIIDAVNGALNNPFGLTDLSEKYPEA